MPTLASDLVGIKDFATEADKDNNGKFIRFIKGIAWDWVYFAPPNVGERDGWKPTAAVFNVQLKKGRDVLDSKELRWEPGKQWIKTAVSQLKDIENPLLVWTTAGRGITKDNYNSCSFDVETIIEGNGKGNSGDSITIRRRISPLTPGVQRLPLLSQQVTMGEISVRGLDWEAITGKKPGLRSITSKLERENQTTRSGELFHPQWHKLASVGSDSLPLR